METNSHKPTVVGLLIVGVTFPCSRESWHLSSSSSAVGLAQAATFSYSTLLPDYACHPFLLRCSAKDKDDCGAFTRSVFKYATLSRRFEWKCTCWSCSYFPALTTFEHTSLLPFIPFTCRMKGDTNPQPACTFSITSQAWKRQIQSLETHRKELGMAMKTKSGSYLMYVHHTHSACMLRGQGFGD